ncbi:type IV pilus modification protein PilV [Lysobacter cavernae]|uniref:Type IV pilus modification protein PilV n=1 Tax=Lysobacter cavernae TaxID=1685901 RepID=A0ABV7RQH4_9GAMM
MSAFVPIRAPHHQRGVGLIEVLIAVLVMAIGLLGIAALQATALRNSQSSLERSQAVIQSYTIFDAMRANRIEALGNAYNVGMICKLEAADTLAKKDIAGWLTAMQRTLGPTTCGKINCDANGLCTVSVRWDDSRASGGDTQQTIETKTYL